MLLDLPGEPPIFLYNIILSGIAKHKGIILNHLPSISRI